MVNASVRDLRYRFSRIEALLQGGEEIQITRRKRVIARLVPLRPESGVRLPDFAARLAKIYGKKKLAISGAQLARAERDERDERN
jgi:antitoxin (DNA-binding transcriptional repressor) of toxin-antitoxin stability system